MPYIKQEDRALLATPAQQATVPGELNYLFTGLIKRYIKRKGESYQTYNDVIGALECCKLEVYRRLVSRYEEYKIAENGDVF
jgi:hypothetical protein